MHPKQSAMDMPDRDLSSYLPTLFFQTAVLLTDRLDPLPREEISYEDDDRQSKVQHGFKRGMISK